MREFPNRENIFGLERTGVEVNEGMEAWFEITRQLPGAVPAETLSIVDGGIAPLSAELLVDTEGEAPADDLEYIVLDGTHAGMCLYLKAASPDRLVRVVHNPNAESGVILSGGSRALSHLTSLCLKRVGNHWEEWSAANIQGAGPEQAGLVPSGGGAGQFFGVSDDGLSYEFKSVDLSAFTEQLGQHGERHDAHGAVAEAEAGRIIVRDAEGRAQVSAPEAAQDIANKGYVDALGVSVATVDTVMRRDAAGRASVAAPSAAADIANKAYVDGRTVISWSAPAGTAAEGTVWMQLE